MMQTSLNEVLTVLTDYFDGIYEGDGERLRRVFHERVRLFCPTDDELVELDLASYLELVKGRPSPASRGDARYDQILSLEFDSATTAHARVRCAYLPKLFSDDLVFVRHSNRWQIVAKVWHYTLID